MWLFDVGNGMIIGMFVEVYFVMRLCILLGVLMYGVVGCMEI